ncbi:MAG: glycosyltransferase family 2 protein [Hallerella porci]|uniref:Glycosyltransferase involved in cell wall biosynthesis n=1 Tax=Hallerella porci TaxID=1945871 RepID=A0ABX5LNV1_9BACT|nr:MULTISPECIES: glycosyltransferase family 2 protein [Hallerella]MCI5600798.1 glycosyltransferase family 2 protein [Hallerella sp.]MDY3920775.1 glycosyltransferase family 2 protein [Hallerella porci]PWL04091.1 glycosyltransferase involved in cell wall biosynthesis [Hallerella porci]
MDLSLVIPVKDEAENLPPLMEEIIQAITPTGKSFEVIVIDDGSRDDSWKVLRGLAEKYDFLRLFRFQFNCGKADALSLGFSKSRGDLIATLDGDLQDDPREIPKMMKILDDGYDLVSGWKVRRHDPWHKTWPSKLFNLTVSLICGKRLHDFNCGIKLYRSSVVRFINLYGDFHRFIPVMAKWQGARITEMPVAHRARIHGSSKYGVSRLVSGFLDLLTLLFLNRFATKPLHFFGLFGLIFLLFGGGVFGYFGLEWIQTGALHLRPLIVVGGFSLLMGVQLFSLGFLAELFNRNKKQRYPIAETVRGNIDEEGSV